jgi:putative flippase GtrA
MSSPPAAPGTPGHHRALPVYIGAGFLSVAGHYATTIAAVELLHAPPLAASAAGFVVGATIKYFLNYFIAFRSDEKHAAALVKFLLAVALLFVLNALFFALLQQGLGLHYIVAQLLTTGLLIVPGYFISRMWVFAAARRAERGGC